MMTESEAREIIEKVLARATAEHITVRVNEEQNSVTRFANNAITQNVVTGDRTISADVAFGQKNGTATVNATDDASLAEVVARAEAAARLAPEDPEYMPPPEPADFPPLDRYVEATAAASPEARARLVLAAVRPGDKDGLSMAGVVSTGADVMAIGNNRGLFGYHRATDAVFSVTADSQGASGWAQRSHGDLSRLEVDEAARIAIDKAKQSAGAVSWPAGHYTAVLEPAAVTGLLGPMAWGMDAKDTFEGRTFLSGKVGKKLVNERVTLVTDPLEARLFGRPWFSDGIPARKVTWIDKGTFVNLHYDRYTAKKHGVEPTPLPRQLVLSGGSDTLEGLIASTDKGILITHFWYIRFVDPMKMLLTGMTRDGLFAIEEGKITGGLKNFRWNMSTLDMLSNLEGMTSTSVASDVESSSMLVPALKVADWDFTSETSF
jgi:predicted Zn-dependent protease